MLALVVTLIVGYFFTQAAGYVVHRVLHNPISGPAHNAHSDHHWQKYPPEDYLSEKYRHTDWYRRPVWYYLIPAAISVAAVFMVLPTTLAIVFSAELVFIAWLNDWLHSQLHIRGHWLERHKWFLRLRDLHWQHHVDESKNIGIFSWFSDKIMRTFVPVPQRPVPYLAPKTPGQVLLTEGTLPPPKLVYVSQEVETPEVRLQP